jgi:hypothetical protein
VSADASWGCGEGCCRALREVEMGILDWFKNRPAQFDPDRVSDEMVRAAVRQGDHPDQSAFERAACLPRRLRRRSRRPSSSAHDGPVAARRTRTVAATWSRDPALRAFFRCPDGYSAALGRSDNLRTLFDKFPELDEACLILGMAFNEQRVFGMALHGDMVQRDVVQTSVSFSDHRAQICGRDESRLRRVVGVRPSSICWPRRWRKLARSASKGRNWRATGR